MPYKGSEKDKTDRKKWYQSHKEQWVAYREAHREKIAAYQKEYQGLNKEKLLEWNKKYKQDNRDILSLKQKEYNQLHIKDKREYDKEYCKLNREKKNKQSIEYVRQRRKTDINFRILMNLGARIRRALCGVGKKSNRTIALLGCSVDFLKQHIENNFKEGMAWDNYGKWEIDHITPCYKFNLSKIKEQNRCFNYLNLQPLWANENASKGGRIL